MWISLGESERGHQAWKRSSCSAALDTNIRQKRAMYEWISPSLGTCFSILLFYVSIFLWHRVSLELPTPHIFNHNNKQRRQRWNNWQNFDICHLQNWMVLRKNIWKWRIGYHESIELKESIEVWSTPIQQWLKQRGLGTTYSPKGKVKPDPRGMGLTNLQCRRHSWDALFLCFWGVRFSFIWIFGSCLVILRLALSWLSSRFTIGFDFVFLDINVYIVGAKIRKIDSIWNLSCYCNILFRLLSSLWSRWPWRGCVPLAKHIISVLSDVLARWFVIVLSPKVWSPPCFRTSSLYCSSCYSNVRLSHILWQSLNMVCRCNNPSTESFVPSS